MPLGGLSSLLFPSHHFDTINLFSFDRSTNRLIDMIDRLLLLFKYKYKYGFYRVELRVVLSYFLFV
jgi:hypothetical protein